MDFGVDMDRDAHQASGRMEILKCLRAEQEYVIPPLFSSVLCLYHRRADQCPFLGRSSGFTGVLPTLKHYAKNRAPFILHFGWLVAFSFPLCGCGRGCVLPQHLWEDAIGGCCLVPLL